MIERVTIRNFQSLTNLDIALQPLTVIVGPSSSGKSAFIRALTALIRNRRGTEFITHGERTTAISAHLGHGIVTLTRSTQTAPNAYTLIQLPPRNSKQEFTKLGGDVPLPVSEFLGITPIQAPLTIASQFDPPYLLSASPTEAARIFGTLTNASILLNAARESNRRKLQAAQLLRTRATDLDQIKARIPEFRQLHLQANALTQADSLIGTARIVSQSLSALTSAIDTLTIAQSAIPALRARLQALPDPQALSTRLDTLSAAHAAASTRQTQFHDTIRTIQSANLALKQAHALVQSTETAVTSARRSLSSAMAEIAQGFEAHFREHNTTAPGDDRDLIDVHEAAVLAAAYVSRLDT